MVNQLPNYPMDKMANYPNNTICTLAYCYKAFFRLAREALAAFFQVVMG